MAPLPALFLQNRQRRIAVDQPALRRFAAHALSAVATLPGQPLQAFQEISIVLLSDAAMARHHLQFMGLTGPTDVLTFHHGEILIGTETAARYASELGQDKHDTQNEIALYLLHGLLHLAGYNDSTPAQKKRMFALQTQLFESIQKY